VFALQRILRCVVSFHIELGRLPPVNVMAGSALAAVGALEELTVVGVLVAIRTLGERERLFEIAVGVARTTGHSLVLAEQREFGFGVIEIKAESRADDTFPTGRCVTRLAALLCEAAFVRIAVAVIALREGNAEVARLLVGARRVTLLALDLRVLAGQRITGLGVIESTGDVFPVSEVVALLAIWTEASIVLVFVASGAGLRDADESAVEVLDSD
jgi:hypothetical protein